MALTLTQAQIDEIRRLRDAGPLSHAHSVCRRGAGGLAETRAVVCAWLE